MATVVSLAFAGAIFGGRIAFDVVATSCAG